ncbi:MAG: type 1 periplasmic-binding domain-containing protein [Candidatus Dormibacteria bacterium]
MTVVVYLSSGSYLSGNGGQETSPPTGTYVDLAQPAQSGEFFWNRYWRAWMIYFNRRYQTYKRLIHIWLFYGHQSVGTTPQTMQADAADNFQRLHPFAAISNAYVDGEDYISDMASKGVLSLSSALHTSAFYKTFPKLIWGFLPATDGWAELYAGFACRRLQGQVVDSSGPVYLGQTRKYGVFRTTDPGHPELQELAAQTISRLQACGMTISDTATFPLAGYWGTPDTTNYSGSQMARFHQEGVTTILWLGGLEPNFSKAAAALGYDPEWMIEGDQTLESNRAVQAAEDQSEWSHAWVLTPVTWQPPLHQQQCYEAYAGVDPGNNDSDIVDACFHYQDPRQLFTAIQVAGPRLTPGSIDQGLHAIPALASADPQIPACYYLPGDYTCTKDSVVEWWDPSAHTPYGSGVGTATGANGTGSGCWRVPANAHRYRPSEWPNGDVAAGRKPDDRCNAYDSAVYYN